MNIGMLWFDNDPKVDLPQKVTRAADYYRKKYGEAPTLCYVNPAMLDKDAAGKGEKPAVPVEVKSSATIMPNHLWIGKNGVSK
jgi:hypothetical protein